MAQSLELAITVHEDRELIWIYLSDWILACILGWFLLFYFDRYVGLFILWLCKLVLWRYYKTRVNVELFKISFLAGRMFAKNVTIINGDRLISLLNINITWRYWLFRRTRVLSYIMGSTIDGESPDAKAAQENESLPTRFMIMVDGLEVFWYNCKYAYDDIAEKLQRGVNGDANTNLAQSSLVDSEKRSSSDTEVRLRRQLSKEKIEFDLSAIKYNQTTLRVLLKIFPVGLIIKRGAIVIGNPTVPTLMCVTYKQAAGILDIAQARSRLDPYRMLNNFNFDKLQLTFKANIGFDKDRFGGSDGDRPTKPPANIYLSQFQRALNKFDLLLLKLDKSRKKKAAPLIEFPQTHQWRGLHRYLDGLDDVFVIDDEEYAKVLTVLDTTSARLSYYYDFCGHQTGNRDWDDPLPEHAVEIEVLGAIIQYGAWADKQRIPLQRMFFPVLARDLPPVPVKWSAGARRQFPGFTASLQVKDELVLRIPTREPNKDKERLHKGHALQADPDQNMRPFGWLELKMGPTLNFGSYTLFVLQNGSFPHRLDGYFCELEVRLSVNHDILFMADSHELNALVGFPLAWNGACDWTYSNVLMGAELYLLREHVFLMADIFLDFALGDPTPYEFLREFTYRFDWKMLNYQLFFNVNDHNIISNPLDRENNTYLAFLGSELLAEITTPLVGPLTKLTTIHYKLSTPSFNLELHTPPWHTTAAFMRELMTVGQLGQFDVGGLYTFFDVIEVNALNYIEIRCHSDDIMLKFYGFVIKYLFLIRENYFGDFVHFKTFEEYLLESPDEPKPTDDDDDIANIDYWKILKTDNDVDVFFTFQVRRGIIILPAHVYNLSHHVSLMFDTLDVDIRFTNYYMDLEADFSPVFCRLANMPFELFERYFKTMLNRASQGVIDGLGIHAHRMFGIPPAEITYNAKWDFEAGQITIDSDPNFMKQLIHAIKCTAFGFSDMENSLNIPEPPVYDAFSITFQCPVLKVGLKVSQGGRLVTTVKRLLVLYNDYPNNRYLGRVTVLAPVIDLEVYNPANFVVGAITTLLTLNNFVIKHNGAKRWQLQQRHIQKNDAPFHRDPFLLAPQYRDKQYQIAQGCFATLLTLPDAHAPLRCGQNDLNLLHGSLVNLETTLLLSSEDPTIWPTANYDEEEFTPEEPTEAEFEYDNIVVEVGNVDGFFGLVAANIVVDVADSWSAMRLESIMDELQIKVVLLLKRLMNELKAIINARVVASKVNLLYGDFAVKDTTKVNRDLAIAQISIDELLVAVLLRQEKEAGQHLVERVEHMSAAGHVKRVSINVFEKSQKFFDCLVEDIEMWMTQLTGSEPVILAHVENVAMMLEDSHWLYLINLLEDTKARVKPLQSRLNVLSEKNHDMLAKFVYLLTKVLTDYEIDHDPGVLTKPAYVLRLRPEHVRFFDGWKLTARIRHLLDLLPVEWRYQPDMFSEPLPANAYEFVTNVFSRWRSWEADDDQRKFFFDFVFNREIKQPELGLFFEVKLSGMSAQLQRALEFDFVAIENLTTVMKQQEVYQAPLNKFGVDLLDEATTFDVVLNIGSVKGKMSLIVLNLLQLQLKSNRSTERDQKQEPEVDHAKILSPLSSKSQNIFVLAVVGIDYSLNINLPLTSIDISGDVNSDIEVLRLETIPLLALVAMQGNLDVGIFADDHQFAHLRFAESEVVGGLCGDDVKVVEILVEKIKLQGGLEVQQVKMVLDDVSYLRSIFESGQDPDDVGKQSEVSSEQSQRETQSILEIHILKSLGDISLSISVSQFVAEPQLDPLFGTIIVRGIEADVLILPELLSVKALMIDMRTQIKLRNVQVLFVEVLGSNFVSEIIPLGNVLTDIMANARLQTRECRVEIPQLVNALKAFIVNLPILESKASELKELFPTAEKSTGKEISEPKQSKKIQLPLFKISVICTLVSILTMVNDLKVLFELHDNKIAALNVEHMEHGIGEVPIFGEAVVNSTRLVLDNRAVNVNQLNVLDVNLNMRVFNHLDDNSQAIQLKLQWCRVCLTLTLLTKLLTCADVAMAVWSTKPPRQAPTISANTEHASSGHLIFAHFSLIQILAYNFCLGWLFTNSRKDYPGVNMGAERFFAILDREMGKFTLLHAYILVANGNRASNFFLTGLEVLSLNRAFLPRMQVIYLIEEDADGKDMRVMVMGDAVDIKYLLNLIVILEQALELLSEVENYLSLRKKRTAHAAHPEPIPGPAHSHKPMFKQVEVTANFEGSKILLYRIEDCEPELPGLLYLSSPSVRVAMLYKHLENASKSHELKLDVFTSSSSNILHSQCVPILSDIVLGIRRMMRKQNPSLMPQLPRPDLPPITPHVTPRQPALETFDLFSPPPSGATHLRRVVLQKSEAPSPAPPQKQDGIMNFLSQLDLHVGLRIQLQRLTLSCEPTVKVAAEVGMEGIHFQVNLGIKDGISMLVLLLLVEDVSALLQHVYLREILARVGVRAFTWLLVLELGETALILLLGNLTDVDGYVNVKQILDVELFKDIWFPRDWDTSDDDNVLVAVTPKMSHRFEEVLTTNAFPWVLTLVLTNLKVLVDFGSKLGDFSLVVNQGWVVLRKLVDWTQDLKAGVDEISLTLVGRLGCVFRVEELSIHTSISWKLEDEIVEVPLVLASAGVRHVGAKLSFDDHIFAMAVFEDLLIDVFNQKLEVTISKDHLLVQIVCHSAEIFVTTLTAASFMDIHNTVDRMMQEKRTNYKETLRDGVKLGNGTKKSSVPQLAILQTVKKLELFIQIVVGHLVIYVFPSSFEDSKVLMVKLDKLRAQFSQNEYQAGTTDELELKFNDLRISLSKIPPSSNEFVQVCTVLEFSEVAHKASGGGIFAFPSFRVSMRLFQKYDDNVVEYLYQSLFGGTVDIKWNLGLVNFIREMYMIHKRALDLRRGLVDGAGLSTRPFPESPLLVNKEIENAIDSSITKVERSLQFIYKPLAPPIIEAPQLKELGNATPPLEWFGLHRNNFPDVTHQVVIVGLQRVTHEVESQYTKLLGKA